MSKKPLSDINFVTWDPKPPIEPSSIVIIASWFDANSIISFSSKGFANLASKILILIPLLLITYEAFLN